MAPDGKLSLGPNTYDVPLALFDENRRRLSNRLKELKVDNSIVVLQGGDELPFYDTDVTYNVFRPESFFMWTFAALEPGCYGALVVDTNTSILFIPRYPPSYAVWMGPIHGPDYFKTKYGVDKVHYTDEISVILHAHNPTSLVVLDGTNDYSGLPAMQAVFPGIESFTLNKTVLYNEMSALRSLKTDYEMGVMRYVINVSSAAHRKVMRMAKAGISEYQCESTFLDYCYYTGGCRFISYTCICCSGPNSAIMHYGHAGAPNDRMIKTGDHCLFDMGANYFGYAADITCTFPENGKFSNDLKMIYNIVLNANLTVFAACKPGVWWTDMHFLALRKLLEGLTAAGLLVGNIDEMMAVNLGATFQPHGTGHMIGLDVHDVGAYLTEEVPKDIYNGRNQWLRFTRILQKGMCFTIEPGIYFIDSLLDEAFLDPTKSRFMVAAQINRFRGFGGVRIEDNAYITDTGCEMLTNVPRTVQEVEDWINGVTPSDRYD